MRIPPAPAGFSAQLLGLSASAGGMTAPVPTPALAPAADEGPTLQELQEQLVRSAGSAIMHAEAIVAAMDRLSDTCQQGRLSVSLGCGIGSEPRGAHEISLCQLASGCQQL